MYKRRHKQLKLVNSCQITVECQSNATPIFRAVGTGGKGGNSPSRFWKGIIAKTPSKELRLLISTPLPTRFLELPTAPILGTHRMKSVFFVKNKFHCSNHDHEKYVYLYLFPKKSAIAQCSIWQKNLWMYDFQILNR